MSDSFIRVNIAGFMGPPVSVFCMLNRNTHVLTVVREEPYEEIERAGFFHVSNQDDDYFDMRIQEDDTRDAVEAFLEMDGRKRLLLSKKVERLNPGNKIERDGIDANGMRYRINPEVNNGQVAILFACLAAQRQTDIGKSLEFHEELYKVITI